MAGVPWLAQLGLKSLAAVTLSSAAGDKDVAASDTGFVKTFQTNNVGESWDVLQAGSPVATYLQVFDDYPGEFSFNDGPRFLNSPQLVRSTSLVVAKTTKAGGGYNFDNQSTTQPTAYIESTYDPYSGVPSGSLDSFADVAIGNRNNNNGEGVALSFSTSGSGQAKRFDITGAMIAFQRTGSNSKGQLDFGVKTSTSTTANLTIALTLNDDATVRVRSSQNATSASSAALVVDGGLGLSGALYDDQALPDSAYFGASTDIAPSGVSYPGTTPTNAAVHASKQNTGSSFSRVGVFSYSRVLGQTHDIYAAVAYADADSSQDAYGVYAHGNSDTGFTGYGVYARATNGDTNYAVYAADGGIANSDKTVELGVQTVTGAGGSPDATVDETKTVYYLDGSGGTCTLALPASPLEGLTLYIKSVDSSNTVTVDRNGNNIDGAASDITLATNEAVTLHYTTAQGWRIL